MIQEDRVRILREDKGSSINNADINRGEYIFYWMRKSQRTNFNHALEYAVIKANKMKLPIIVYFGLYEDFYYANKRHFSFLLEGLKEVNDNLKKRGINFVIKKTYPPRGAVELAKKASLVITDRGYLKFEKDWRDELVNEANCPVHQVESDVVIPVNTASDKEEYAAHTLRKKIMGKISEYLHYLETKKPDISSLDLRLEDMGIYKDIDLNRNNVSEVLENLNVASELSPVEGVTGGEEKAKEILSNFLQDKLPHYETKRNDPSARLTSGLSPYLHFGQISPLHIALEVYKKVKDYNHPFLEQLIVRRELGFNFVEYNNNYHSLASLPDWAKNTLNEHKQDVRKQIYSLEELEEARTYDKYFNAAQTELLYWGKIHGYMRMYWGKKIIQWTNTPKEAHKYMCYLNDKYALDGRDVNGYTNILWCFGKHDRPFQERKIFGKVRYMSENALKRNGNPQKYVSNIFS